MFERYLVDTIATYFGHLIENFDKDKVRVSAWNGEIVLKDLSIRKNALDRLFRKELASNNDDLPSENGSNNSFTESPIEIAFGRIGNLEIRIPWKNMIRSKLLFRGKDKEDGNENKVPSEMQVQIVLSGINILITPARQKSSREIPNENDVTGNDSSLSDEEFSPQNEEEQLKFLLLNKERKVQSALDAEMLRRVRLSNNNRSPMDNSDASASIGNNTKNRSPLWIREMLATMLSNLCVTIKDVHIRYEDPGTSLGFKCTFTKENNASEIKRYRDPFSIGFLLKEFSIQNSAMSSEESVQVKASSAEKKPSSQLLEKNSSLPLGKKLVASEIASYWDSDCQLIMSDRGKHLDDDLEMSYFQSTFKLLNDSCFSPSSASISRSTTMTPQFLFHDKSPHFFLIDPFSPSMDIAIGSVDNSDINNCSDFPSARITLKLPYCHINMSRRMLEDVSYLRKSISIWMDSNEGLGLSDEELVRLTNLRPSIKPSNSKEAARAWWRFAFEAVCAIKEAPGRKDECITNACSSPKYRRKSGWLGLSQLLGYRRKYVTAFIDFLMQDNDDDKIKIHEKLLNLESELFITEVVMFRISVFDAIRMLSMTRDGSPWLVRLTTAIEQQDSTNPDKMVKLPDISADFLSHDHRYEMFIEMAQALERERSNIAFISNQQTEVGNQQTEVGDPPSDHSDPRKYVWKFALECPEFSLQINDAAEDEPCSFLSYERASQHGIVQVSLALGIHHDLFSDASWNITTRVGVFRLKDCNQMRDKNSLFPYLIRPKDIDVKAASFSLDNSSCDLQMLITVHRKHHIVRSGIFGSSTTTKVFVFPLEIVYSTAPMLALNRVFDAVNVEFADDYHRLASKLTSWRRRQQDRFLKALAQKEKQIFINLDVGAPVLLIPESTVENSQMIVLDLGHIRFEHREILESRIQADFDDQWQLDINNIQVQCTTSHSYRVVPSVDRNDAYRETQQVVEPFSLNFSVLTRVIDSDDFSDLGKSSFVATASLPTLVFNVTTSTVRLWRRLQEQWEERTIHSQQRPTASFQPKIDQGSYSVKPTTSNRYFEIRFLAPFLNVKFEDDTPGTIFKNGKTVLPLFDFVLKGLEGSFIRDNKLDGSSSLAFTAKVQALFMIDLHQQAGRDFELLLSSVPPAIVGVHIDNKFKDLNRHVADIDLVTFEYKSSTVIDDPIDTFNIRFNELFMEWNPETIAAINRAVKRPIDKRQHYGNVDDCSTLMADDTLDIDTNETFFDANEDDFYDASEDHLASFSSRKPKMSEFADITHGPPEAIVTELRLDTSSKDVNDTEDIRREAGPFLKPLLVTFSLSKLRVSFNKDARHRKLVAAEMDRTLIQRTTHASGKSKINLTIGNLTFSDSESHEKTLYKEILGLQTDYSSALTEPASLLEMEILGNTRCRKYLPLKDKNEALSEESMVSVDLMNGEVHGFDTLVKANFSPMRFVYVQQIWLEVIDYFFEGILGYDVWGNSPPSPIDLATLENTEISSESISFTRFEMEMLSPVVLFPISCCSTDFVKLEATTITIKNTYNYRPMRASDVSNNVPHRSQMQWYNNCSVAFKQFRLKTSFGNDLNKNADKPNASISLSWPVGPKAPLNAPKWRVDTVLDTLSLYLHQEDYALLQHIVQYNIGEETRHTKEWLAVQSLSPDASSMYRERTRVHFSYDQKDVAPTTFQVTVQCQAIFFFLVSKNLVISEISFSGFSWRLDRDRDRISQQNVAGNVELLCPITGCMLLRDARPSNCAEAGLTYKSRISPSGDSKKILEISNSCILLNFQAWRRLSSFFQGLPEPNYVLPDQVIQVGDRWYNLSKSPVFESVIKSEPEEPVFRWLDDYSKQLAPVHDSKMAQPLLEFHFYLRNLSVQIACDQALLVLSMKSLNVRNTRRDRMIHREIDFIGLQVHATVKEQEERVANLFLIQPWDLSICQDTCDTINFCCCAKHSIEVKAEKLHARAAYTDMKIVLDIWAHVVDNIWKIKGSSQLSSDKQAKVDLSSNVVPDTETLELKWDGIDLVVIDDSLRHFALEQCLIIFSVDDILVRRVISKGIPAIRLHIKQLEVTDCLQTELSPYRKILVITPCGPWKELYKPSPPIHSLLAMPVGADYTPGIDFWCDKGAIKTVCLTVDSIEIQYNPSVVIALQRFLGRLSKNVYRHNDTVSATRIQESKEEQISAGPSISSLFVKHLNISLNKENQRRRLIEVVISDIVLTVKRNEILTSISGSIGSFLASDPSFPCDTGANTVVKSIPGRRKLATFCYAKFPNRLGSSGCQNTPKWILSQLESDGLIDDFFDVSLSSVEVVYLRERTEELLDYMKNGMPGKGMGFASVAAKDFVTDRIKKRSFFNVYIDAPALTIPSNSLAPVPSLKVWLRDFAIKSWINESSSDSISRRVISVELFGFSGTVCKPGVKQNDGTIVSNLDVSVMVDLSSSVQISLGITDINICMAYTDYDAMSSVYRENVGRRTNWSNIEKQSDSNTDFSSVVSYSSTARLITFGQGHQPAGFKPMKLTVQVGSLSILLRRDSRLNENLLIYDILLIKCQCLDLNCEMKEDGDQSLSFTAQSIYAFDLGQRGRTQLPNAENLEAVCVVVTGYCPPEGKKQTNDLLRLDSQLVAKIDKESNVTKVALVISNLRIVPLSGLLRDVTSFFLCEWSNLGTPLEPYSSPITGSVNGKDDTANTNRAEIQFRIVLHYPQLVLLADEGDHHCRALILRGLAISNATFQQTNLNVNADFQNISSYVCPDVASVLRPDKDHLAVMNPDCSRDLDNQSDCLRTELIGVPLLLPLTISLGFEFEQNAPEGEPRRRCLSINVDPLSLILSNDDIILLQSVVAKISAKKAEESEQSLQSPFAYDVVFTTIRLGLGLRKENGRIFVESVDDDNQQSEIAPGDALHSVNGEVVLDASGIGLSAMVRRLTLEPRPLTLSFLRMTSENKGSCREISQENYLHKSSVVEAMDKMDVSLVSAIITLTEKDVPLFRGSLRSLKALCASERTCNTKLNLEASGTVAIDYYNLRTWGWEPALEPGDLFMSVEYNCIASERFRELALEFNDRATGIKLNISDALINTFSKYMEWSKELKEIIDLDDKEIILSEKNKAATMKRSDSRDRKPAPSAKAANAALRYAIRQKNDSTKPFVFRNRTGISVAFVQQRKQQKRLPLVDSTGEYFGLKDYNDPSEVMAVASGEDLKFRINLSSNDLGNCVEKQETDRSSRFPLLSVALKVTNGLAVEPFTDLQIVRSEVTLVPLVLSGKKDRLKNWNLPERVWALWSVEQEVEKSILTLRSSISIDAFLEASLEIGMHVVSDSDGPIVETEIKDICTVVKGESFSLPLWLAMQQRSWRIFVRIEGYSFTPLCDVSPGGVVVFGPEAVKNIECKSSNLVSCSVWLTAIQHIDGELLSIKVESSVSFRNLLPVNIELEALEGFQHLGVGAETITSPDRFELMCQIKPGECVDLYCKRDDLIQIRVRPFLWENWSSWLQLDHHEFKNQDLEHLENSFLENINEFEGMNSECYVQIRDKLNYSFPLGMRISKTLSGLDVSLYAELWCTNSTALNVMFGCPREQLVDYDAFRVYESTQMQDFSAAEAALKEMSSLFDPSYDVGLNEAERQLKVSLNDVVRLPKQRTGFISEEIFEYIEVEGTNTRRHWWASEDASSCHENLTQFNDESCADWGETEWKMDTTGNTSDGWESSPNLTDFSVNRTFNNLHRIRRRRWFRSMEAKDSNGYVDGVNAFYHSVQPATRITKDAQLEKAGIRVAIQVDGGKWTLTSNLPSEGSVHGVIRVSKARWPRSISTLKDDESAVPLTSIYELCYSLKPLNDNWGLFSRSMIVTSRFLLRNDSTKFSFEVKQYGSSDSTKVEILPGTKKAFHWSDCRLPELISVRPTFKCQGRIVYKWSGGFDPLNIGPVPLRIRKARDAATSRSCEEQRIRSIKLEADIRPRTGGTGITLSFREEDEKGDVSLFRIENLSPFPIWFSQDGILTNPSLEREDAERDGDMLRPNERTVFALDVPFRQGKYTHRKAATMNDLLRIRISLAPLSSRAGVETMKPISLNIVGERVRLNPSKLEMLTMDLKASIEHLRVVCSIHNDGPTRVLFLRLAQKSLIERAFVNPFADSGSSTFVMQKLNLQSYVNEIVDGAFRAAELSRRRMIPSEDDMLSVTLKREPDVTPTVTHVIDERASSDIKRYIGEENGLLISFSASFVGLLASIIDSSPAEVAVISLKNINSIASWNAARTTDSTLFITVTSLQVDNMLPNAPFPVALCPDEKVDLMIEQGKDASSAPLLVVGLSFAPKHKSGIVCLKSVTIAPRNLVIQVDLGFVVRLQRFLFGLKSHFTKSEISGLEAFSVPDVQKEIFYLEEAAISGVDSQKYYFGGLTILPTSVKLSVAPARALTVAQAAFEGEEAAAIHQAVRKGDVRLDRKKVLGVKLGSRNKTPLAVVRGMLKSFVVDALLRLDGASLNFSGVFLYSYTSTTSQLTTALAAHYIASLRQNLPALVGSMAALGNPMGLVKGLGDGVSDFVLEPVKGLQRSVQEMDATYLVDGVARGTLSLARHTVGGFADSAAMLAETFSKNMTVLTLDRRYAQKRDRVDLLREHDDINVALGLGSGVQKLVKGFLDGVTGIVKAPIRGAEKNGLEGFAKGIGKGLLGLLVKPIIGISDGFGDVMIGVKGSVDSAGSQGTQHYSQIRLRRALYGQDKHIRVYNVADAAASALMLRTRLAGESYFSHVDMADRVALISVKRLLIIASRNGAELLVVKLKHIESVELRNVAGEDGQPEWGIIVLLRTPRENGSEIEVITCHEKSTANLLYLQLQLALKATGGES